MVAVFVGGMAVLLVGIGVSLRISNAVRAYVAGEGFWSRAQKDAVFALDRFARTHEDSDYADYLSAIRVNLGDRLAREELLKPEPDEAVAARGFELGRNSPLDIPDMIFLFRYFHRAPYLREAIQAWTEGDAQIDRMRAIGERLRNASPGPESEALIPELDEAAAEATRQELRFSATLAEGARWVHRVLMLVAVLTAGLLLIAGLLAARRIAQAVEERLLFETLVARLSSSLTTLTPEHVDDGINSALADIGQFAQVDRSYVFLFNDDHTRVTCTHEWCAPGISPQIQRLQNLPVADFPWVEARLQRGEIVHVPRVASLPKEAAAEQREWQAESIQSLLLIPMRTGGTIRGYVGFDSVRSEKTWPDESNDLLRIFGEIVLNIVTRMRAEQALMRQNQKLARSVEELARSNAELEQFAYAASHDLNTPLRGINGFIELLRKRLADKLDEGSQEYITLALNGVAQMQQLISGLLAISRIGRGDAKPEATDCEAVMIDVSAQLGSLIAERKAEVTHDPLPVVMATPVEVGQLLQNLIGNAIKFNRGPTPHVHVSAQRDGDFWRFAVHDNGIGIKPEYQQKIFDLFQRLHSADQYEGSGIGLAICRKIVQRHGGRIWVESEEGEGSTFSFTLPKA